MKLDDLQKNGAFVDSSLIPQQAVWQRIGANDDGEPVMVEDEVQFFVRRASHSQFKRAMAGIPEGQVRAQEGLDPECLLICACIRLGENGEEQMSYEQADSLEPALFKLFIDAVNQTYGSHLASPKRSPRKTNSGAKSSSTASGAKPSVKRKRTSRTTKS